MKKTGFVIEDDRPVLHLSCVLKSVPQGAATHVWFAVSPQLDGKGGVYCADYDITPLLPQGDAIELVSEDRSKRLTGVDAYSIDADTADERWPKSQGLTGLSFQD